MIARIVAVLLIGFCSVVPSWGQVYQGTQLVHASLLSDTTAVVPGKSFRVGVLLEMAPGWHTYWEYPGDSGLPTQLTWTLPEGWKAGPIEWPMPERVVEPGNLVVYAYKNQVLLITTIRVPANYSATEAEIQVAASWLVCEKICVPGDAKLSMTLPVEQSGKWEVGSRKLMNAELFDRFTKLLPSDKPVPYKLDWRHEAGVWTLTVSGLPEGAEVDFYPLPVSNQVVGHVNASGAGEALTGRGESAVAKALADMDGETGGLKTEDRGQRPESRGQRSEAGSQRSDNSALFSSENLPDGYATLHRSSSRASHAAVRTPHSALLKIPVKGEIRGVLEFRNGNERKGYFVQSPSAQGSVALQPLSTPPTSNLRLPTLLMALLYGFLGGLILNLMPCVLPVISLKIFGFIQQAGHDRRRIFAHGMAFVAGIFLWFLGLALVVVLLRAGGAQVNWAFQFQNPWFILGISAVVFVFALNLFGVFEVILPGKASSEMAEMGEKQGYAGSFFQGVFATLLATPCTAPFLGTALGFAFSQPAGVIFAMFGAVALGMASPYFLLSAQPGWTKFLPRPGGWMERVKQLMGFPLIITLVWLLSIIGGQKGVGGIIWAAAILVCLAFASWLYGEFVCGGSSVRGKWIAAVLAIVTVVWGGYYFGKKFSGAKTSKQGAVVETTGIPWQPYSKALLDQLLAEGKPVFVDFTADWCLTCKFNEKTAIDTPAVRKMIAEKGIVPLRADWTNQNPEIGDELRKYGRVGVPFYLVFSGNEGAKPIQLPELLTERIVLDALGKVGK